MSSALEVIAKLTAGIEDARLPSFGTLPITGAEAYAFHLPYFTGTPELYQPATRQLIAAGATVTATAYIEARRELDRLRRSVGSVFSHIDLVICPTSPMQQMTIEEAAIPEVPPPGAVPRSLRNTQPFDIFGLPTISIPCGFTH